MGDYMEETGDPFTGKKKEELKKFLEYMGLTYDEQITHSIVLRKEKEIIATASCQKNNHKMCCGIRSVSRTESAGASYDISD